MYEPFFGLTREPFSVAPDPHFMYMSPKHREALGQLLYGLRRGAGFVLLTGEVGAGKTTVWRAFLEQLPSNIDVAYVVNPKLAVNALLTRVCEDLRIELPAGAVDLIDAIHGHLLLAYAKGRRTLIVVDEAQSLAPDVLEQLRLLTNLDSTGGKLQVLLIGQPELRAILWHSALEPLAQRVVARFHLPALPEAETARYIAHRLTVAGLVGQVPFDDQALRLIHELCGGVPRRINVLCDRALLVAQSAGSIRIDRGIVERAADEAFGRAPTATLPHPVPGQAWPRWQVMAAMAGGALAIGGLLGLGIAPKIAAIVAAASAPRAAAPIAALPKQPDRTLTTVPVVAAPAAAAPPVAQQTAQPQAQPVAPPRFSSLDAVIEAASVDESLVWRNLARQWGVTLGPGEPCAVAVTHGLRCYRAKGGLGPIRQLSRPGILKLVDERGRSAYAMLVGLAEDGATFRSDGVGQTVLLTDLARGWRGEFATFWRPPPGYRGGELVSATGELAPWLGRRLATIDGASSPPIGADALTARVFAFQVAQGLDPDGLAGPLTLMQINRASGIEEPRLQLRSPIPPTRNLQ